MTKALFFVGAGAGIVDGSLLAVSSGTGMHISGTVSLILGVISACAIGLGGLYHQYYDHSPA